MRRALSQFGEVKSVSLAPEERGSGRRHRGFGQAAFSRAGEAEAALSNGEVSLLGRTISIAAPKQKKKLSDREHELRDALKQVRTAVELNCVITRYEPLQTDGEYAVLVSACGRARDWRAALDLLEGMGERGIRPTLVTLNTAMTVFGQAGKWKKARETFEWLRELEMEPDLFSYSAAISAIGKAGEWRDALRLFDECKAAMKPNVFVYGAALAARGLPWAEARALLAQMRAQRIPPNVIVYNSAIHAAARSGEPARALELLRAMEGDSLRPTVSSYNAVLDACAKASPAHWELALQILPEMRSHGVRPDAISYNCAVAALAKAGEAELALQLLGERRDVDGLKPNAVAYNLAITACAKSSGHESALALLAEARELKLQPDAAAFSATIAACANAAQVGKALEVLHEAERSGVAPSVASVSQAVWATGRTADAPRALALVDQAIACGVALDTMACNGVIHALANALRPANCVAFLDKMRHAERGLPHPDIQCCNSVLKACAAAFHVADAAALLAQMEVGKGGLPVPDVVSYNILVDMHGKDHQLDRSFQMARRLQRSLGTRAPDSFTLTSLVYACLRCRQSSRVAPLLRRAERERWAGVQVGDSADATAAFAVRLAVAQAAVEDEDATRTHAGGADALSRAGRANAERAVEDALAAIRELEAREGGVGTAAADALIVASIRLNVSATGWAFAREQFEAAAGGSRTLAVSTWVCGLHAAHLSWKAGTDLRELGAASPVARVATWQYLQPHLLDAMFGEEGGGVAAADCPFAPRHLRAAAEAALRNLRVDYAQTAARRLTYSDGRGFAYPHGALLLDARSGATLAVGHNRVGAGGELVHAEVDAIRNAIHGGAGDGIVWSDVELLVAELDMDTGGFASAHPCAACTTFLLKEAGLTRVWHTTANRGLVAMFLK